MKPYFSISVLFFLLLLALNQVTEANRLQQHYWKHVMGDESMPDAIKDLLPRIREGKDPVLRGGNGDSSMAWGDLIKRDFDTRSVAIIYHHHDMNGDDGHHVDQLRDDEAS